MSCSCSALDAQGHPGHDGDGADHLSLALFPLASMADGGVHTELPTVLTYQGVLHTPEGRVTQTWTVRAASGQALPTAEDMPFLIGLLALHHAQGFASDTVEFSGLELFRTIGMTGRKQDYVRLTTALKRFTGLFIEADKALYGQAGRWESRGIHLVEEYALIDGRSKQRSFVRWGRAFHETLQRGDVRPLDLRLYIDLKRPTSRSLFRLLEHYRAAGHRTIGFPADELRQRLGMLPCEGARLHQRLKAAHQQLTEAGVISAVAYQRETFTYTLADPIRADLHDFLVHRIRMAPSVATDLLLRHGPLRVLAAVDYSYFSGQQIANRAGWVVSALHNDYEFHWPADELPALAVLLTARTAEQRLAVWLRARRIVGIDEQDITAPLEYPDTWPALLRAAVRFLLAISDR